MYLFQFTCQKCQDENSMPRHNNMPWHLTTIQLPKDGSLDKSTGLLVQFSLQVEPTLTPSTQYIKTRLCLLAPKAPRKTNWRH